jgi:hypothetical protein
VGAAIASGGGALEGGGERGVAALPNMEEGERGVAALPNMKEGERGAAVYPNMEEGERGAAALASNVSRVRASRGDGVARALAPAPALGINLP